MNPTQKDIVMQATHDLFQTVARYMQTVDSKLWWIQFTSAVALLAIILLLILLHRRVKKLEGHRR